MVALTDGESTFCRKITHMAIFSRRIVQQMPNENASFMSTEGLDRQIARLNKKGFQVIDTEWEVAVLNAFSKVGFVEHEPALRGTSKLDLLFTHIDGSQLLADITTVSDEGHEKETGVRAFEIELKKRLKNAGLLYRGWSLSVGSHPTKKYGEQPKPALPPRNEFAKEIFNANFKRFLALVNERPSEQRTYNVSTHKSAVALTYLPDYKYFMTQLPTNNPAVKKNQNPVFNSLKMKANQFKKAGYDGPKAIILCDGGSQMVRSQPHGAFEFNFNAADAAKDFLRQNRSIDCVVLLASVMTEGGRFGPRHAPFRKVQVSLVPNTQFSALPTAVKQTIANLQQLFPEPENTAYGARETIRNGFDPKELRPFAGGWMVSSSEIRIFSNAVFALLAGLVTQDELFENLGFKPQSTKIGATRNPFEYQLSRKSRIEKVDVEHILEDDASYLIFHFNGTDPARSPFRNPKKNPASDG